MKKEKYIYRLDIKPPLKGTGNRTRWDAYGFKKVDHIEVQYKDGKPKWIDIFFTEI